MMIFCHTTTQITKERLFFSPTHQACSYMPAESEVGLQNQTVGKKS